ncbi:FecR family protein [Hymenobacter terrenus]|uniref:FecR family protein n=1 Tax=Hymenobacter terrenus TaxID=1629124 RepID=UPI000A783E2C|nr:FecR domain-containing protein [Hymenobacter terrenus]
MHDETNWELLAKYLAGECTAAELQQVTEWVRADRRNHQLLQQMTQAWELSPRDHAQAQPNSQALWQRLQVSMRHKQPFVAVHTTSQTRRLWPQQTLLRIAASVLLVLGIGLGAYYWPKEPTLITQLTQTQQQKTLTLPDGTKVWLNEGSKLSYPPAFAAARREVTLEGEAYFEVVHLRQHQPFVVKARGAETTVLGTSFDVTTDAPAGVTVSVVTGRVQLAQANAADRHVLLTKGWTGVYNPATQQVQRDSTTDLNFLAWKTGVLTFRKTPVRDVMAALTTYYHRPIVLQDSTLGTCRFTGTFVRQPLDSVLQTVSLTFDAQVRRQANSITLQGGTCQ